MSTELVEEIHVRLREEIDRLGISLAEAARSAGEKSPQRIKDVVSGKQRCPAELLARLEGIGVDIFYVITGKKQVVYSQAEARGPSAEVVPIGIGEPRFKTQQEVLITVLDAIHQIGKTLPAKAIMDVVAGMMAWQRAGASVTKSSVVEQLRRIK